MAKIRGNRRAFGWPGIEPRWTHGDKVGVGTAYSAASRIWFTLWNGIITEVYHPTVDRPQVRDLQFLISDGKTFFHEEKRHLVTDTLGLLLAALVTPASMQDRDAAIPVVEPGHGQGAWHQAAVRRRWVRRRACDGAARAAPDRGGGRAAPG